MSDKTVTTIPFPTEWKDAFAKWWEREGRFLDPDFSDVPWFDKREALAEMAFNAAMAQSSNYIADDSTLPEKIVFANGRVVSVQDHGDRGSILSIGISDDR